METSAEHNSTCNKNCSADDMDVLKSTTDTNKLSVKYDNLADVDDDKRVNNHKICTNNNRKNSKIIRDDTDCSVVIDNNDNGNNQTKQLQQQPSQMKQPPFELSPQSPPLPPSSPSPSLPQQQQQKQASTYGCKHYKRKAKFVVSNTQTPEHT